MKSTGKVNHADIILYLYDKYQCNWQQSLEALKSKEKPEKTETLIDFCTKNIKDKFITIYDDDYLDSFNDIKCPPVALFYKGDYDLVHKKPLGIVGNLTNNQLDELASNQNINENFVLCFQSKNMNQRIYEILSKNNIKFIVIADQDSLDSFKKYKLNKNVLFISEFHKDYINPTEFQISERLFDALTDCFLINVELINVIKLVTSSKKFNTKKLFIDEKRIDESFENFINEGVIKTVDKITNIFQANNKS